MVRETGRKEWRWNSGCDRVKPNKRGWLRTITRVQYLYVEFTCGHWQRADFIKPNKSGMHWCDQCESGTTFTTQYDQQEAATA